MASSFKEWALKELAWYKGNRLLFFGDGLIFHSDWNEYISQVSKAPSSSSKGPSNGSPSGSTSKTAGSSGWTACDGMMQLMHLQGKIGGNVPCFFTYLSLLLSSRAMPSDSNRELSIVRHTIMIVMGFHVSHVNAQLAFNLQGRVRPELSRRLRSSFELQWKEAKHFERLHLQLLSLLVAELSSWTTTTAHSHCNYTTSYFNATLYGNFIKPHLRCHQG